VGCCRADFGVLKVEAQYAPIPIAKAITATPNLVANDHGFLSLNAASTPEIISEFRKKWNTSKV
jgi:hypothetical protein